ncbi:tetratricopeptide repeat protein [Streptomyces sp. HU2014]|uniref:tetratricopeptide repeat protein n=1 Tax=Streptomyces sp. HU2014 TaxID=2939414 RepID=UPI0024B39AA1|nr:tetratricopeptide repeat protein [Streptomyces sp. HU2014]
MVPWERLPWVVGVRRTRDGAPNGVGVLVTDRHVITCAHVTVPRGRREPPDGPVYVRFQHTAADPVPAVVAEGGWHPQDSRDWTGDVAVLELRGPLPPEARPAPLVSTQDGIWGHTFHAYGYPEGTHKWGGVSTDGRCVGPAETEWIQLQAGSALGQEIAPGFSGSPVWDMTLEGVIGIVVTRDRPGEKRDPRTGYAIPVERLAHYWPPLTALIRRPEAAERRERQAEQDRQDRLESLLELPLRADGQLPKIREIRFYDIGVTPSKDLDRDPDPPYAPRRREDALLDRALASAPFILVTGDSKAGKSRTLIELLRRRLPEARLVVPDRTPSAPGALARLRLPTGGDRAVLWLDDLDDYLQPGGVDLKVLGGFARLDPPVTVVATLTSERLTRVLSAKDEVSRTARTVLGRATRIELSRLFHEEDLPEARRLYEDEDFTDRGIGERMVAAPLLEETYNGGREGCPDGWAVVRAAVDWQRMGCGAPLTESTLRALAAGYRAAAPPHRVLTDEAFRTGLAWAMRPVAGSITLLGQFPGGTEPSYRAFAYLPGYLDHRPVPEPTAVPDHAWRHAVATVPTGDLLGVAFAAFTREQGDIAVLALERAHDSGDGDVVAWASLLLGEVALNALDVARARALLEEAAGSGRADVVPLAQVDLAAVLNLLGRCEEACHQLELALASHHPQAVPLAQAGLGGLLIEQGEPERARGLLESALASGDPQSVPLAEANLGGLLLRRGEMSAPRAAAKGKPGTAPEDPPSPPLSRPADATSRTTEPAPRPRGEPPGPITLPRAVRDSALSQAVPLAQVNLSALLLDRGELDRARTLLESALASANPMVLPLAQDGLGRLLAQQGEFDLARPLVEAAAASPFVFAAQNAQITAGWMLWVQGDKERGRAALERVADHSDLAQSLRARHQLALLLATDGDREGAAAELRRVADSGHESWALLARVDLGAVWTADGDHERAARVLTEVARSGHPEQSARAADLLGDALAAQGEWAGAEGAYRRAIGSRHPVWAPLARLDLAMMLVVCGDERARGALQEIADSAEADHAPRAADLLGDLLARRGDHGGAEAAYGRAIGSGHPHWSRVARIDLALMLLDSDGPEKIDEAEALLVTEVEAESFLSPLARCFLGQLRVHQGNPVAGRELLESAAASDSPEAVDIARLQLGKMAADAPDLAEAEHLFEAVLASGSAVAADLAPLAKAHLGAVRLNRGDTGAALEMFDEPLTPEEADDLPAVLLGCGMELLDAGEIWAAEQYLARALDLGDAEVVPRARAGLGMARLAHREFAEALPLLESALREAMAAGDPPAEHLARRYLGSALARLERYEEAKAVLVPLARSADQEERPQALLLLGRLAADEGAHAEARAWFGQAVETDDATVVAAARVALGETRASLGAGPERERESEPVAGMEPVPVREPVAGPAPVVEPSSAPQPPPPSPPSPPPPVSREPGLPAPLLVLLAQVAYGEGQPGEARYWLERAEQAAREAGHAPDPAAGALPEDLAEASNRPRTPSPDRITGQEHGEEPS